MGFSTEATQKYIEELQRELEEQNRGIRIRISGAGVELVSAVECADYVGHIRKREDKLSNAAMETLAVIAYKQPITKAEIEEVRGVNSDKIIKQLLTRSLIAELGHKDTVGRPILYGTTDEIFEKCWCRIDRSLTSRSFGNRRIAWNDYKNILPVVVLHHGVRQKN